jgi:hypothetical protein
LLLKDFSKYLRDDDPNDPTNFVLKKKMREGQDYKLLPKKVWDILYKRFNGMEIARIKDTEYYNRKFIIHFPCIPLLTLPGYDELDPEKIGPK